MRKKSAIRESVWKAVITAFLMLIFAFCVLRPFDIASAQAVAPKNPDSAKECAICHYNWIDTFFVHGRGSDLVEYTAEKVAAKPEMCFSCHDGSVVDSRARVYNDHRHRINQPPPHGMEIPKIFPLDQDGKMQCFTCHTAHGVPSDMSIETTIFLRTFNNNSEMCRMCHADKTGGIEKGNHPVDTTTMDIPRRLFDGGAKVGEKKNQIICETCHTVHGSPYESFLVESARDTSLCVDCHSDKDIFTPEGNRNHNHVINVVPVKTKIPEDLTKKGARLGREGEIICQTCHKVHNNKIEKKLLLIKQDNKSSLCLTCHTDKQYIADTKHNLMHSAPAEKNMEGKTVEEAGICSACHLPHKDARKPGEGTDFTTQLCLSCHSKDNIAKESIPKDTTHPLNVKFSKDKDAAGTAVIDRENFSLPLYERSGVQNIEGEITCSTCHDPHRWQADSTKGEISKEVKGDKTTSFLRKPAPEICRECHGNKFYIANSKHDIGLVAPEEKNILGQAPKESDICGSCHLVHGGGRDYLWAREETKIKGENPAAALCVRCHNEKGMAKKKVITDYSHPLNISLSEKGLSTTLPLYGKDGKVSQNGVMVCQTCHDPHRWDPARIIQEDHSKTEGDSRNSFLRTENSPSSRLCENCHQENAYVQKTDHDLIITAPDFKNSTGQVPSESGTCGVCHLVHNSMIQVKLWAQGFAKGSSVMDMMCNYCHNTAGVAKDKIPKVTSHPEGQLIINIGRDVKNAPNYFPLFDKDKGAFVTVGNISCSSCHNVHQWDPRSHVKGDGVNIEGSATNSFLRMQTFNLLCVDCHGLDALFRYKYYHDPEERVETTRNPLIPVIKSR
ncbi:MAG: hypothetical protein C4538_12315 [Nitrospiraceae bacterium]|nr:MAG: hypothetical protein C4538_12315 [Nitrospiraceae bacterium]